MAERYEHDEFSFEEYSDDSVNVGCVRSWSINDVPQHRPVVNVVLPESHFNSDSARISDEKLYTLADRLQQAANGNTTARIGKGRRCAARASLRDYEQEAQWAKATGRGRMDREHQAHGEAIKDIYIYPLVLDARQTNTKTFVLFCRLASCEVSTNGRFSDAHQGYIAAPVTVSVVPCAADTLKPPGRRTTIAISFSLASSSKRALARDFSNRNCVAVSFIFWQIYT